MNIKRALCILLTVATACSLCACNIVTKVESNPPVELGELTEFRYHPGYCDMDGEYHYESLEKNDNGEWVLISSNRTSFDVPTVTTVYAVTPEGVGDLENFIKNMNVAALADKPDSDLFVTDYTPWNYDITFTDPSSADGGQITIDIGEYKEYSDEDNELLKYLKERFENLKGEVLSEVVESDGDSYDTGDLYCVMIAQTDSRDEYDELMKKLDDEGYYYLPDIDPEDYSAYAPDRQYNITSLVYPTEEEAQEELPHFKEIGFEEAHVENIGQYIGNTCWIDMLSYDVENIGIYDEYIVLTDVPIDVPYMYSAGQVTMDVFIDKETGFSKSPEMSSAGNYREGMTAYEWVTDSYYLKMDDPDKYAEVFSPLDNLINVTLDGDRVETIHGVFYWDI